MVVGGRAGWAEEVGERGEAVGRVALEEEEGDWSWWSRVTDAVV